MRLFVVAFAVGVCALQLQPALPGHGVLAVAAVAAAVLLALRRPWAGACAGLLLGACWAALLAHAALADRLAPADEGKDTEIAGVVEGLPYRFDGGVRF